MTLGLVLRATPLRESDLVLTLLTEQHGRISALARGARSSRRRFAGALGFGVLARYHLKAPRGEMWTLESADVVQAWLGLAADLGAFAHAGYVLELVSAMAAAEHADPDVFALTVTTLERLATSGASAAGLRSFELALLDATGSAPGLEACVGCGTTSLDHASFAPGRGGVVCRTCAATTRGSVRPIDDATRRYLLAVQAVDDPAVLDAAVDGATRGAAREAVGAFIEHLLGHGLRSVEFLAKLNAGLRGAPS